MYYDVYDDLVSMGIVDRLRKMGVKVITFEMMDEVMLDRELDSMKKDFGLFPINY